ncbi:integral membrane protein 2C-like [Anneissia japonica]|uniref:integral membrane protein 2C-like n=1 Tax=Anneissia japonica TaxID=1529436 RepID=UPI001425AFFE|nr:integral membrane protein 2C-like [Anneissia japonica]
MVKPTLNPKPDGGEKDEIKKEKDIEAALKDSGVETQVFVAPAAVAAPTRPRRCGFCCVMLVVLLFAVIAIGTFFALDRFGTIKRTKWCGVTYDTYLDQDAEYINQEPQQQWCYEDVDIDVTNDLETIDKPDDEFSERVTIMHDYKVNLSAYHLLNSRMCYVKYIDPEIIANPAEFWKNFQDPEFFNHHYEILYETYTAVEPAITNLDSLGPNIAALCNEVPTYWIQKLPSVTFLELWNMFVNAFLEYGESSYLDERVRRDVAGMEDTVNKVRNFDGKFVTDMKILPPNVIDQLENAGKLSGKFKTLSKKYRQRFSQKVPA